MIKIYTKNRIAETVKKCDFVSFFLRFYIYLFIFNIIGAQSDAAFLFILTKLNFTDLAQVKTLKTKKKKTDQQIHTDDFI